MQFFALFRFVSLENNNSFTAFDWFSYAKQSDFYIELREKNFYVQTDRFASHFVCRSCTNAYTWNCTFIHGNHEKSLKFIILVDAAIKMHIQKKGNKRNLQWKYIENARISLSQTKTKNPNEYEMGTMHPW